jgi:hypothetical protein
MKNKTYSWICRTCLLYLLGGHAFLQIKLKSNHEYNQKRIQKVSDYLKLCMEKVNFLEDFSKHYESNTYATRKRKGVKMCFLKIQQHTRGVSRTKLYSIDKIKITMQCLTQRKERLRKSVGLCCTHRGRKP